VIVLALIPLSQQREPSQTKSVPLDERREMHTLQMLKEQEPMLARSQLYRLAPMGMRTVWVESLTSYIHRLAAKYKVKPRAFVTEVMLPHLVRWHETRPSFTTTTGGFYRREAIAINGAGEVAANFAEVIGQLNRRSDVRELTFHLWANPLPARGLLRWVPAWCPACYTAWRANGQALYQPLLWMLQVVTVCPRHHCFLIERCSHCQQRQSVIAAQTQPGYCTQCTRWLGTPLDSNKEPPITDALVNWQEWVMGCIEELYLSSVAFGALPWANLPQGLQVCREAMGDGRSLARLTNLPYSVLWPWSHGKQTPSFKRLLEFGYVLDVTPLQLLVSTADALSAWIAARAPERQAPARKPSHAAINWEQIEHNLREVLAGRKSACGVSSVARQVGISAKYLRKKFPQECTHITAQYRKDRATQAEQRVARQCLEVRHATQVLYEQGVKPSKQRVQALLSDAHILRRPECRATWHAVRRELGLES
jgi:hypothetical protein